MLHRIRTWLFAENARGIQGRVLLLANLVAFVPALYALGVFALVKHDDPYVFGSPVVAGLGLPLILGLPVAGGITLLTLLLRRLGLANLYLINVVIWAFLWLPGLVPVGAMGSILVVSLIVVMPFLASPWVALQIHRRGRGNVNGQAEG